MENKKIIKLSCIEAKEDAINKIEYYKNKTIEF